MVADRVFVSSVIPWFEAPAIHVGSASVDLPTLLAVGGALVAMATSRHGARRAGLSPRRALDGLAVLVLCGLLFGHLTPEFASDEIGFSAQDRQTPSRWTRSPFPLSRSLGLVNVAIYGSKELRADWRILLPWHGGYCSLGVFLGIAVGVFIAFRAPGRCLRWEYLDVLIPAALVGATIVRIGCFVGHHHAGRLTSFPLGVAYPGGARHDLGLCEAMLLFALMLAAAVFGKRWRAIPGRTTAIGCAAYAVGRFAIEFLRGDDIELLGRHSDPRYWGLTLVQYATLGLAALALWGLWRHREHARGAAVSETTAGSTSVAATETEIVKGVKVEQASRET